MKACKRPVIPCYTRDKEGDRNEVAIQKMDSMPKSLIGDTLYSCLFRRKETSIAIALNILYLIKYLLVLFII